jgi:hypothetical protein
MARERIVAVGLLTQRNLDRLGTSLDQVWPIDKTPCFGALLQAIDEADREIWRERDAKASAQPARRTRSST